MKKNKVAFTAIIVLVILTAVLAVVHQQTRTAAVEGHLLVESSGGTVELPLAKLDWSAVQGSILDGKGESHPVDAQGVPLSDVLRSAGVTEYTQVSVVSDDEYSADVTAEEIAEPDKVYLTLQEDGTVQLIVFGDPNSKRNVRNTARLVVA